MAGQGRAESAQEADKRWRILDAALGVFAEYGVHGTAVPPIARQAGVAVGTLYRYFASKEQLVNAVFRETKALLGERLLSGLDLSSGDVRRLFEQIWERLVGFAREEPAAFRFLEMQDHAGYLDASSRQQENTLLGPLRELIHAGQQNGVLNSGIRPEVAIALFWGGVVGLFKADKHGYLELAETDTRDAREACWRALAAPAVEQA